MIDIKTNEGEGHISVSGNRIGILADLNIAVAHILTELECDNEDIKMFFEATLKCMAEMKK